jgi:hypothetical protein
VAFSSAVRNADKHKEAEDIAERAVCKSTWQLVTDPGGIRITTTTRRAAAQS